MGADAHTAGRGGIWSEETTPFVGRGNLLARLRESFASRRLVVLVGPGGFGKTTLARRFTELAQLRYAETLFCEIGRLDAPGRLASRLAMALGVAEPNPGRAESLVVDMLSARGEILVVLDELEHALPGAATSIARWLEQAPNLSVLVTSRVWIAGARAVTIEVGPLAVEARGSRSEAVELLLERASMLRPGEDWTDAESDLCRIAERLDGVPLALELAAYRLADTSPKDLLDRLEDPFGVLEDDSGTGTVRHGSLEHAIAWSWQHLRSFERSALVSCSVFSASFDVAAAEAVIDLSEDDDAPPVLDVLQSLRHGSWLSVEQKRDGRVRLRLLPIFGTFIQARGAPELLRESERRYVSHYVSRARSLTERLEHEDRAEASEELVAEHGHWVELVGSIFHGGIERPPTETLECLVALEPALAMAWPSDERVKLARGVLERAREAGPLPRELEARALCLLGRMQYQSGDGVGATHSLEEALRLADGGGPPTLVDRIISVFALARTMVGDHAEAYRTLETLLAERRAELRPERLAQLHFLLGFASRERGERARQAEHVELALEVVERLGGAAPLGRHRTLLHEAACVAHLDANRPDDVVRHAELLGRFEPVLAEGTVPYYRASALFLAGKLEHALRLYRLAWSGYRRRGHIVRGHDCALNMARAYRALGRNREAIEALEQAPVSGGEGEFAAGLRGAIEAALGDIESGAARMAAARESLEAAGSWAWLEALALEEGHLDIARAERAAREGDSEAVARNLSNARARLKGDEDRLSFEVHLSRRALRESLERSADLIVSVSPDALVIQKNCDWFALGVGPRVTCQRRPVSRSILSALALQHERAVGHPISIDALIRVAWPDARVDSRTRTRLHQAIRSLRKLGLHDHLELHGEGYRLRADTRLQRVDSEGAGSD